MTPNTGMAGKDGGGVADPLSDSGTVAALQEVARSEGWDRRLLSEVETLVWALFRYYVWRIRNG